MSQLQLKKFDMKRITFLKDENKGPVVVLIGRRDTGKSFLVRDLLYHHRDIPIGTVISGTEAGNGFYSSHVPKLFIHDEYNTSIIENILKRQKTVIKEVNKQIALYKKCQIDPRAFVILDDCNNSADLKFQLGFLTEDQKKEITNYKQLLGVAYRTSYDQVNLKGQGFIYIAPEKGPNRPLSPGMPSRILKVMGSCFELRATNVDLI
jgi:guanylate kinase